MLFVPCRQSGDIPNRSRTFSVLYRGEDAQVGDPLLSLDLECDDDKVSQPRRSRTCVHAFVSEAQS
jgi:hypothetical protein